jgi:hypothetical protein
MAELVGGDQIALGTKQYLLIAVVDTSGVVTDLGGSSPKYTVQDDANNYGYNDQAGTITGMILYCLIDTTVDPVRRVYLDSQYSLPPVGTFYVLA